MRPFVPLCPIGQHPGPLATALEINNKLNTQIHLRRKIGIVLGGKIMERLTPEIGGRRSNRVIHEDDGDDDDGVEEEDHQIKLIAAHLSTTPREKNAITCAIPSVYYTRSFDLYILCEPLLEGTHKL